MLEQINKVIKFNDIRGLTQKGFDATRENSFTLSEELEVLDYEGLAYDLFDASKLKEGFNHDVLAKHIIDQYQTPLNELDAMVEYIDKGIDHWFFTIGGMAKMGLSAEQMLQCFNYVLDANELKPIGKVNDEGKQQKGEGFELVDPKHKIKSLIEGHLNA